MALWDDFLTKAEGDSSRDLKPIVKQSPKSDGEATTTQTPPPSTTSDTTAPTKIDRSGPIRKATRVRLTYSRFSHPRVVSTRPQATEPRETTASRPAPKVEAPPPPPEVKASDVKPVAPKLSERDSVFQAFEANAVPPKPKGEAAPVKPPEMKPPEVKAPAPKSPPAPSGKPGFLPPMSIPVARPLGRPMGRRPVKAKKTSKPPAKAKCGEALVREAKERQAKGDHQGAVGDLTKAIEVDPGCAEAYEARGISRERLGDVEGARADYEKAIGMAVDAEIKRQMRENPDVSTR